MAESVETLTPVTIVRNWCGRGFELHSDISYARGNLTTTLLMFFFIGSDLAPSVHAEAREMA